MEFWPRSTADTGVSPPKSERSVDKIGPFSVLLAAGTVTIAGCFEPPNFCSSTLELGNEVKVLFSYGRNGLLPSLPIRYCSAQRTVVVVPALVVLVVTADRVVVVVATVAAVVVNGGVEVDAVVPAGVDVAVVVVPSLVGVVTSLVVVPSLVVVLSPPVVVPTAAVVVAERGNSRRSRH